MMAKNRLLCLTFSGPPLQLSIWLLRVQHPSCLAGVMFVKRRRVVRGPHGVLDSRLTTTVLSIFISKFPNRLPITAAVMV